MTKVQAISKELEAGKTNLNRLQFVVQSRQGVPCASHVDDGESPAVPNLGAVAFLFEGECSPSLRCANRTGCRAEEQDQRQVPLESRDRRLHVDR